MDLNNNTMDEGHTDPSANPGFSRTMQQILCCMCGTPIAPNPANMCAACIRTQVDITEGIPTQLALLFCRACGRYQQPPNQWVAAELESRELLGLVLKRIKGLNRVKLIDAAFIWTEPHSRRIKVKLTIQKEVFTSTILQQSFVVEFTVNNAMCDMCHRARTDHTWRAVVQLRQKVTHKRTFLYLEQIIMKHDVHKAAMGISEVADGLDFFYSSRTHANKFVEFLQGVAPIRHKTSERLISMDKKSNIANVKYSISVELPPVCKDDLVVLPKNLAGHSRIGPLCLCSKISGNIFLIDPFSGEASQIIPEKYWQIPFQSVADLHSRATEYLVREVEPIDSDFYTHCDGNKPVVADIHVARLSDVGVNDTFFITRSHLGRVLKEGDTVMGYDMTTINFSESVDITFDQLESRRGARQLPDVVLVKKSYPQHRKRARRRHWKLKSLNKEMDVTTEEPARSGRAANLAQQKLMDYELFLQELEEDKELRASVNLYRDTEVSTGTKEKIDGEEDYPEVGLEELIDEMTIDDTE